MAVLLKKRFLNIVAQDILLAHILIFCSLLGAYAVFGEEGVGSGKAEGSIYHYSEDDAPEVFFFPPEKARWNGYAVTLKEWYMLTDLQKEKFISEYTEELRRQYRGAIEIVGLDYLKALNLFSDYVNDKAVNESPTKFIDELLREQGKIRREGAVSGIDLKGGSGK